jgi:hypothetical protein
MTSYRGRSGKNKALPSSLLYDLTSAHELRSPAAPQITMLERKHLSNHVHMVLRAKKCLSVLRALRSICEINSNLLGALVFVCFSSRRATEP